MSDPKQKETGYLGHQRKMSGGRRDAGTTVLSRTQKHYVWQPHVLDFLGQSQFQLFPHLVRPHIPIFWLEKVTTKSSGHLISTLTQRVEPSLTVMIIVCFWKLKHIRGKIKLLKPLGKRSAWLDINVGASAALSILKPDMAVCGAVPSQGVQS